MHHWSIEMFNFFKKKTQESLQGMDIPLPPSPLRQSVSKNSSSKPLLSFPSLNIPVPPSRQNLNSDDNSDDKFANLLKDLPSVRGSDLKMPLLPASSPVVEKTSVFLPQVHLSDGFSDNLSDNNSFPFSKPVVSVVSPQESSSPVLSSGGPLFISIQDYRSILHGTQLIKDSLSKSEELISSMDSLKEHSLKTLELWQAQLEDVERKLAYVDEVLAQATSS